MVFLLKLVGDMRDSIAPKSLRQLEETSLELLRVTVTAKSNFPATYLLRKLIASNCPTCITSVVGRLAMPQWARIFLDAYCKIKKNAAQNYEFDSQRPIDKDSFYKVRNIVALWLNCLENSDDYIKETATDVPRLIEDFRDFGLIRPDVLGRIVVDNIAFESVDGPSVIPIPVELIHGVTLRFGRMVRPFSLSPIQTISKSKDLHAMQEMTRKAFELLDAADTVAELGRSASRFSEFLIATHICFFLYSSAGWILSYVIKLYEGAGYVPPEDLYKEKQVAEENRVETSFVLRSFGGILVEEPIAQLLSEIVKRCTSSNGIHIEEPGAIDILESLHKGATRIPSYPDSVYAMWGDILVDLNLHQMLDLRLFNIDLEQGLEKLYNSLREYGYQKLPHCFSDAEFVEVAKDMIKKWGAI